MRTTEKKTETITIRITKETADRIAYNAREERRKPAELVALWVEDIAEAETLKKCNRGSEWARPVYVPTKTREELKNGLQFQTIERN